MLWEYHIFHSVCDIFCCCWICFAYALSFTISCSHCKKIVVYLSAHRLQCKYRTLGCLVCFLITRAAVKFIMLFLQCRVACNVDDYTLQFIKFARPKVDALLMPRSSIFWHKFTSIQHFVQSIFYPIAWMASKV